MHQKKQLMKHVTLIISLFLTVQLFAQNKGELVIFSNLGEKFYVILNGVQQNQLPASNVKVDGLADGWYSCRVLSENNLFSLTQNVGVGANVLVTYHVINKKGEHKLRYFSEAPLNSYTNTENLSSVTYHTEPFEETVVTQTTSTTQTTTTSGTTSTPTTSETINVGISAGTSQETTTENVNVSININTSIPTEEELENGTFNTSVNVIENGNTQTNNTSVITTETTTTTTTSSPATTSTSSSSLDYTNCIVDASGMEKAISMVKNESFSEDKMRVAKQFSKKKCLTVNQIKQFAELFSFSEDILEYVTFAYDNCLNKDDYYELLEVFTFSDDKRALEDFINSK